MSLVSSKLSSDSYCTAGADPGLLVGGGANIQICQIFPKNCMKLRKFWSMGRGGGALGAPPLDRPLVLICHKVILLNTN